MKKLDSHPLILMLGLLAIVILSSCSHKTILSEHNPDWSKYKNRFINASGQVIDNGQRDMVHSEGQSYGMLLAVSFADRATFDRIWRWTKQNLQVRKGDKLLAWKWNQSTNSVADMNNSTDADIMTAWSLYRAAEKWDAPTYKVSAEAIMKSLQPLLLNNGGAQYLLPAMEGFQGNGSVELNPSYLIFPAFRLFAGSNHDLQWDQLYRSGVNLLQAAQFGTWRLAPDWLLLKPKLSMSSQRKHYFSYDAIRVPLFAAWSGEPTLVRPYVTMWGHFSMQRSNPDIVDLDTNFVHINSDFSAPRAIYQLCKKVLFGEDKATFPSIIWKNNTSYYDASLTLFAQIAWVDLDHRKAQ